MSRALPYVLVLVAACRVGSTSDRVTGMPPADAAIDAPVSPFSFVPASIEFLYVPPGTASAPVQVAVVSSAGVEIDGFALSLTGDDALELSIGLTTCTSTIPPLGCVMQLYFSPLSDGDHMMTLTATAPGQIPASASIHAIAGLPPPGLTANVSFLDFGTLAVGNSSSQTVTYQNAGTATLPPIAFSFGGESPGEYHLAQDHCTGVQLAPQATCTVDVVYVPTSVMMPGAAILIGTAGNTTELDLRATPEAATMLSISPVTYDFGTVGPASSPSIPFTVTNIGTVTATAIGTMIYNTEFVVTSSTCAAPLAPGASCTIYVQLRPTATGPDGGGMEVFGTNTSSVTAGFSAIAVPSQGVILDSWSYDFGTAIVNEIGNAHTFTVTNVGTMATTVALTMDDDASQFTIDADTCSTASVSAGATCTFEVVFTPTVAGTPFARVHATSTTNEAIAKLSAIASPGELPLTIHPSVYDYGTLAIGQIPSETFLIHNPGQLTKVPTVSLTGPSVSEFALMNDGCTGVAVAPTADCYVDVWYRPATVGSKTASLEVDWTGGSATGDLSGAAFEDTNTFVTSDPPSHDFGNVTVGQNSTFTFPLTNHGAATSPPMSLQLSGPNNGDFSLVSDHCKNKILANGQSCDVTVKFAPSSTGTKYATLQITVGDGGSTALTGTGQ